MLDEVIIEQTLFELTDGAPGFCGHLFGPDPDQKGTSDVIGLDTRLTALAAFKPGELSTFAVQLLNLPTNATRRLCGLLRVLSGIIGHDPIRAGSTPFQNSGDT